MTQIGDLIILGGSFTQARNDNSDTVLTRRGLLAFSATTGQISTTFNPAPGGGDVRALVPAGDGSTVYVGGSFTSIGGTTRQKVARVSVGDGSVVPTFNAGAVTGIVKDLKLSSGRLWLSGAFTHVNGRAQRALTSINPTTGANQTYMSLPIAGTHRGLGVTDVVKMDISPDGSRLVGIGNFDTLAGVQNHQIFMLDLTGATAQPSGFRTRFYTSACSSSFYQYMHDVDFSPDGSFFVIGTTGAYGGSTAACDTVARFETDQVGSDVRP